MRKTDSMSKLYSLLGSIKIAHSTAVYICFIRLLLCDEIIMKTYRIHLGTMTSQIHVCYDKRENLTFNDMFFHLKILGFLNKHTKLPHPTYSKKKYFDGADQMRGLKQISAYTILTNAKG